MATVFELKEKMATLGAAIQADADWISEKAANPETKMDAITEKKNHRDELQKRFDLIKEEHDRLEKAAIARLQAQNKVAENNDTKQGNMAARGEFYKSALTGGDVKKAFEGLGAIPENDPDLGKGENLLPTNMTSELLTEPFETNSLREIELVSNITGLEEPMFEFDIEDENLADVTDKETAKEIETAGNLVSYGRFKTKISVTVKDTVLHGSPLNLATVIENGLRSGLAIKEKMRAFATSPDTAHAHMSFYSTANNVKVVNGTTMLDAILAAYGDLPDGFVENATCVMRRSDYIAMIRDLANGAESLFGKKPEDVIGIPVTFNDRAVKPVVGDFRYARQNYDIGAIFETDKDAKKGEYYFVFTAWGDHKLRLKSAFRIANVNP